MQLEAIKNISVIGAGIMGHGIGLTYALEGYQVTLMARRETTLSNALRQIKNDLLTFAESNLITEDRIEETLSRITTTTSLKTAAEKADFVTETVVEEAAVKKEIFTKLDNLCPKHTILASNTSTLVMRDFAAQCKRQDKILLTHWMNPPHIVPAVEIVPGELTSDEVVAVIYSLLKKVKKVPVRIRKEIPGLVINRVQAALIREVFSLWQQGVASAEDIDLAVKGSFGFRLAAIGPLETCDLGGLDIWYKVTNLFKVISNDREPPPEFVKMVEAGNLGVKTGKGFFDYTVSYFEEGQDYHLKERDNKFIKLLKLFYS